MSKKRRAAGPARTRKPKRPGTAKRRILTTLKWLVALGLVGALVGVGAFVYLYRSIDLPDPNKDFQAETTTVFYSGGKQQVGTFATQNRESIPLSQMPQHLQDAVVSAEDRTFWTNKGIDPKGILRALFNNAQGGPTQGASTITQQYVKILYLTSERSYQRKLKEAVLSLKLQRQVSKKELLEGYLNTIYFGRGAYGVEAAARAYFKKPAAKLTLAQSAVLASVINNPSGFDPATGDSTQERKAIKERLRGRYQYVLDGMVKDGTADQAKVDEVYAKLPHLPKQRAESRYGGQKGFMLTLVRNEMKKLGYTDDQIDGGGYKVTTTFTPRRCRRPSRAWPRSGRPPAPTAASCQEAAAHRGGVGRARHRRAAASTAVRTSSTPRSTGPRPAGWWARRSSRSASRRPWPRASRSRTPSTETPPMSSPTV
ncbi:MAG: biosynthetic peptidoglycan transglycosylase [Nocardioides sp.]